MEWGFAGVSESTPVKEGVNHSVWSHWVDSRYAVGDEIPVDEGDMYDLGNGLCLEHGHAWHPHLGRVAGHEELWRDVEVRSTTDDGGKVCVVLRCEGKGDGDGGVRGVVVRVGQFVEGIVRVGERVATERWEFRFKDEDGGGGREGTGGLKKGWMRVARTRDLFLPCAVTFMPEVLGLGGRVTYGDFEWVVEEVWEWE